MSLLSLRLNRTCILNSSDETLNLGKEVARFLKKPTVIFLKGDLGSGKTTFSKGFISEKTQEPLSTITSPTFTYMNQYEGITCSVVHFDLYRLDNQIQFFSMGFEEIVNAPVFSLIEWPEIIEGAVPAGLILKFSEYGEKRKVELIGEALE